jgi:predicted transcriptional regulator
MAVDKQQAIALRQQGCTHQEIADKLGCSVAWCKANLKGIRKPSTDTDLINEIRRLGKSKEGVTTGEIRALIKQQYPTLSHKQLTDKVHTLKQAARKGNKDVVIRPYWLLPDRPQETIDLMMDLAQSIYERIDSMAFEFRQAFDLDESYHKSVVYQLVALSAGENNNLLPQGILTYGEYLSSVAEELSERNEG